ncbi:MAG: MarR family winged helix-turn-helix transcriptional regulator [Rickettsiales bacterium]|jgi:DNA-binding MarR family transcriptional regulator
MASAFDRTEQQSSQRAKITAGVERLSTVFRAALWEEAKHYSLSPLQVQILLFVAFHDREQCSVTNIAKEFAVTKATISDAVKTLLEKTLLKKLGAEDARGFSLLLTVDGKKCVNKLSGLANFFDTSLSHVPEAEISKIWEGMLLLIGHLQKTSIIPVRMCFSCQHFGKEHPEGAPHYCHFMQKPLEIKDVRIDCPEYLAVPPVQ